MLKLGRSSKHDSLKQQNNDLKARLDRLKAIVLPSAGNNTTSKTSSSFQAQTIELNATATLAQNVPNLFSGSTTIAYSLPANMSRVGHYYLWFEWNTSEIYSPAGQW